METVDIVIGCVFLLAGIIAVTGAVALFTRIPSIPTPTRIADAMVDLARLNGNEKIYDLGAGSGTVVLRVLRRFPSVTATGVELSPAVWFLGFLRTRRYRVRFLLGSLFSQNISDADVVFLYMLPHMMEKIEDKLDAELRPGTVVISHAFPFPHRAPAEEVLVPHGRRNVPLLRYVW